MIKIEFGKKNCCISSKKGARVVLAHKVRNREHLITALHELGHVEQLKWGDLPPGCDSSRLQTWNEINAWAYAFSCIKPEHHKAIIGHALHCVQSYNKNPNSIKNEIGFFYSIDEIIGAICFGREIY